MISPEEHERIFNWLYDLSQDAPFDIKSTAAPMYRRVAIERKKAESNGDKPVTFQGAGFQYADGLNRPTKGVNDGNGFLFISHTGEIEPSGFLPISAGNVKTDDVVDVYRNAPLFRDLRDYGKLKGRCGICEYQCPMGGESAIRVDTLTEAGIYVGNTTSQAHRRLHGQQRGHGGGTP